ncbi:O-antigen ligase family protein [Novosphingobium resinovorum]|uniref:O-antigen ligase family protein n=1 Tax=Novosphingobium TaxID=165696 RepID=UPI001B3C549D|nr:MULTISPECIES: O-antigen ligase family protein [Novosphingobium]MBF7012803.1 O-antigen ligase family protein [Novosphingobium sp. HR1a]WJM27540.1 O-antigen ligase family protein [Novosphingobium resinovorum]
MLIVAVCFGGGGSAAGVANLVVQLAALAVLAFHRRALLEFFSQAPRAFAIVLVVTILLPLVQCIPLPPLVWQQLPGRNLAVQSLALVGHTNDWMPFSLNVRRTFIAFLSLMPPLAILILTWRANDSVFRTLLIVLVGSCIMEIILGTQQLAFGNRQFMLYAEAVGSQDLHGTFANRNTAGLFMNVALCAVIGLLWRPLHNPLHLMIGVALGILFGLGLFLTQSRSSMTLVVVPAAMLFVYLWALRHALFAHRSRVIALAAGLGLVTATTCLLADNVKIQRSLSRFDTMEDARPAIWQDTQLSIARFWPVGSGIGTFDEVFQLDESLENLSPGRAARAHNEYLEITLESGVMGPFLVGSWIIVMVIAAWRAVRKSTDRGPRVAASAVFMLLAFQSILDYPLRSQTLLCVAGLMLGILLSRTTADTKVEARKR